MLKASEIVKIFATNRFFQNNTKRVYFYLNFSLIFILFSCNHKEEKVSTPATIKTKKVINSAPTEKLYFNQYISKDGLPSAQVWNIYQDRFSYIWVATNEGVARFDGYQFYPYYDDAKQDIHLKMASSFFEDSEGTLWVLSGSGFLNKFDRNTNKFIHIKTPFENGWSEQSTHTIIEDSLKNFWIGAYGGLQYFDRKHHTFTNYPLSKIREESWPHEEKLRFGKMYNDNKGNIWIGTRKFGLVKFNIANKTYHCYRYDKENNLMFLSDWITDIVPLGDGTLLISDWGISSLVHFDTKTEKIIKIIKIEGLIGNPKEISIRDIYDEGNQVYALCTEHDGLIFYDFKTNKVLQQYKKEENNNTSISGNMVRCITKDKAGVYWLGASTLEIASTKFYKFKEFVADSNNHTNLRNDYVYSLASTTNNKLLVSTAQGMSVYDDSTQTFDNSVNFGTKYQQTYGVLAVKDGTYWVSYVDKVVHFQAKSHKIIKEYAATLPVDKENVNFLKRACRMMQDSRGVVWTINHWGRLNKIDEKKNEVVQITDLSQDETKQKFVNSLGMIDDPNHQRLIVCTDYGLATVDYLTNKISRKRLIVNQVDLSKSNISYIYKGKSGDTWLIIEGKAFRLNLEDFSLKELKLAKKYNVDSFKWLIESPKGMLWLSCFRGIVKYDISEKTSSIYYSQNVADYTFDSPSPVVEFNNKIYFGGFKGMTSIDPAKVKENSTEPHIIIESVTYKKRDVNLNIDTTQLLYDVKNLELDYYQNKITLKYAGLHYNNANQTKYAFKLEGYDTNWIEVNEEREAIYTNLSPKKYVFKVKSANGNGEWNTECAKINIVIRPPFWLTWWAFLIYLAAISAAIYYFIRFRVQSRLQKIKELEAIRVRISSNLHDDVGTILSGLAMQSQMMALTTKGTEKESLLQLSDMSHEAMERMRDTVWAIDSRKDKYENLIDRMRAFAEKNLNLKNIKHTFKIDIEDSKKFINPEKRQNIYLIFKEAITNICKHSDATEVSIYFQREKNVLLLLIRDNGTLQPKINTDGSGLNNMRMRAKSIGANITIEYQEGYIIELSILSAEESIFKIFD